MSSEASNAPAVLQQLELLDDAGICLEGDEILKSCVEARVALDDLGIVTSETREERQQIAQPGDLPIVA